MKSLTAALLSVFSLFLLTGCWDKFELTQFGFVQAVAIDQTKDGKFELTTHFYKPGGEGGGGNGTSGAKKGADKYINIVTEGDSVFSAVRDISIHFGRKAKWDHMRVVLVGEQLARERNLRDILDYFARDYEPRPNISVIITQGKAGDYLNTKPIIEYTMGQQLRKIETSASRFSGKTTVATLLDLLLQLKSETGIARAPYAHFTDKNKKDVSIAGTALLSKGKLVDVVSPMNVENLLILTNKYSNGILEVPCSEESAEKNNLKDNVEVRHLKSKIKPVVKGDSLTIRISVHVEGSVGELRCASVKTSEETKAFEKHVKKTLERRLRSTVELLQKNKLDAFGVGDYLYRNNPKLWKKWKKDWGERFARSKMETEVNVTVENTGMYIGKPLSK